MLQIWIKCRHIHSYRQSLDQILWPLDVTVWQQCYSRKLSSITAVFDWYNKIKYRKIVNGWAESVQCDKTFDLLSKSRTPMLSLNFTKNDDIIGRTDFDVDGTGIPTYCLSSISRPRFQMSVFDLQWFTAWRGFSSAQTRPVNGFERPLLPLNV